MRPTPDNFAARYGPWAVVAGASEGLGAAFAHALAARGMHLVLLARRAELLGEVATQVATSHGAQARTLSIDLVDPDFPAALAEATADLEIGVGVFNAAFSPIGGFLERPQEDLLRIVDLNVRAPILFARALAPGMQKRGRGALVLMSSLSGLQGSPRIATYAASKAFNTVFAEGLWGELREAGVDVLASCAGAIRTPGYAESAGRDAPGTLDPDQVAEETLAGLGSGPRVVPGRVNRLASFFMSRLLPRATAIRIMAANTKDLS
ncbi:MAG: SDR family NAD(P)-dependent oxidoreductase [Proteobacteria bacterium]|nr:SDR family NAD(P)-dependent oxidoreductase [Pseudomonadota bacterium]